MGLLGQIRSRLKEIVHDARRGQPASDFKGLWGDRSWNELFADSSPVALDDPMLRWLEAPPPDFLQYVLQRERRPFDGVPPSPEEFKKDPTFAITQAHRLWVTTRTISRHLGTEGTVVDLGGFPFAQDTILREYLGFKGRIVSTINLELAAEARAALETLRIETQVLNLDPYVKATEDGSPLPTRLSLPDGSVDLVIFSHVIEHLYHPMEVLKEAARVLRRGGRMVVTTDNAFMLGALLNFHALGDFVHEPIAGTGAMTFHFWRGHNRFFTSRDVSTMLEAAGLKTLEVAFYEILYNSFIDEYFRRPTKSFPYWQANILSRIPAHRNELVVVAERPAAGG